jgi:hypothetical protein
MTLAGRVYYTNLLASIPLFFVGLATGEYDTLATFVWTWQAALAFTVACLLGVAMSYFAFLARAAVYFLYFFARRHIIRGGNTSMSNM